MTEDPKYKNEFTAEDIERYYQGKMSTLEMHQLEKAAMDDPFLADALEGYGHTPTPVQDVQSLRSQFESRLEKGKVVPIGGFNRNQFLRIAALFILLVGCGWAVYQFGFSNQKKDLAIATKKDIPPVANDTNKANATIAQPNTEATTESNEIAENNVVKTKDDNAEPVDQKNISLTAQNKHTGKKLNTNKEEASQVDVAMAETNAVRKENPEATFKQNPASEKDESNNKGFVASAPQTVTPGKENIIVLQRSKDSMIPEVTLGRSLKDSSYRKPHITIEEAEPEDGSAHYDDYVTQHLQMPEEQIMKNTPGKVELSFDVNDAGEAVNIKVEKSLCKECDKEAIRILKEGPRWKKKKNKKAKLSIEF